MWNKKKSRKKNQKNLMICEFHVRLWLKFWRKQIFFFWGNIRLFMSDEFLWNNFGVLNWDLKFYVSILAKFKFPCNRQIKSVDNLKRWVLDENSHVRNSKHRFELFWKRRLYDCRYYGYCCHLKSETIPKDFSNKFYYPSNISLRIL